MRPTGKKDERMLEAPCGERPLIRTFSFHYRRKLGVAVGKIPLDLGIICPNRKNGGCVFCRSDSFSPAYLNSRETISKQIEKGKDAFIKGRFSNYFAYFQQETPTSIETEIFLTICRQVLSDRDCVGLIISTRPDYIDGPLLFLLADLIRQTEKICLFELGLQSVHERSLHFLNRNHSVDDFIKAVARIRLHDCFEVGAHLLFGIPGESVDEMLSSLRIVCEIGIDALKLHHLQVIAGTPLQKMYDQGLVQTFSADEYLEFLLRALPLIPADVVIHRLWASSHLEMLIAPRWNILATKLSLNLRKNMEMKGLRQGGDAN